MLDWLPGRTMSNEALSAPGMPARIAEVLRRLHAGPRFRDEFDMFRLSERYLALVDERGIPIPAGYREHVRLLPRIEAALAVHPLPSVPCHNDLLADNYLDDGATLWIVDWEYSGNNDPTFELGNTCQELGYDDAQVRELCAAYFGEASPALLARMRLQMIMSDVGWTLWAAIQARDLDDRLRLHRLGRGALGAGRRRARRTRVRGLAPGGLAEPAPSRASGRRAGRPARPGRRPPRPVRRRRRSRARAPTWTSTGR